MNEYLSLSKILDGYKIMGYNIDSIDVAKMVIATYLQQDEVPLKELIDLISVITMDRANKQESIIRRFRSEGILSYSYGSNYPKNIADILEVCTRKIIAGMELSENDYNKLKTIAERYEVHNPFYVELLENMHKNGIYFTNEEKE